VFVANVFAASLKRSSNAAVMIQKKENNDISRLTHKPADALFTKSHLLITTPALSSNEKSGRYCSSVTAHNLTRTNLERRFSLFEKKMKQQKGI